MGLTERHWFEYEDVPEKDEWALEDAVYNSRTNKKADMVEVIRCKDCIYYHGKNEGCSAMGFYPPVDDWYCADGKRRDNDD